MPDWVKKERISLKEAFKLFTEEASYAFHENKGRMEKGMLGDFIVLSENLMEVPLRKIPFIKVGQTYINGRLVYQRGNANI